MKKGLVRWLQRETLKDERKIKSHKGKIISKIKVGGLDSIFNKPQVKNVEKVSLWKKLKNLIGFWVIVLVYRIHLKPTQPYLNHQSQ